jgi:PAS domain S-box-containing protein
MSWSPETLAQFLDAVPGAALVVAGGERIVAANSRATALLGYPSDGLQDRRLAAVLPEAAGGSAAADIAREFRQPTGRQREVSLRRNDGRLIAAEMTAGPIAVADQALVLALVCDISDRQEALEALRKSEERLRQVVRLSHIGIFDHDHRTDTIYWSPEQRSNYGWGADEPVSLAGFLDRLYPDDRERIGVAVRRAHDPAGNGRFDVQHRIIRRDGQLRWLDTRSQTFFEGEGGARHPVRTVGAVLDITERKLGEDALKVFRQAIDQASDAIFVLDEEGRFTYVNESACSSLGYTREELLRLSLWDVDPAYPREAWAMRRRHFEATREHTSVRLESLHRRRDGSIFPVEVVGQLIPLDDHQFNIAYVRDISDRRRTEEAMRIKDEAIATSINAIAITDAVGKLVYVNPAFLRLWGYESATEVLGRMPAEFAEEQATLRIIEDIMVNGAWQGELTCRRKDGTTFDVLLAASALKDAKGELINMMGSFLDITERKRLEGQLRQAQKMESIGRLAGGVAHDFNNLLTAIIGNVSLALLDLEPDTPLHEILTEVNKAAGSAADLTRQLLAFSRRQMINPKVLNLNEVLIHLEKILRRLLGEDVDLRAIPGQDLGQVRIDPSQIEQILVNLAVNGRDAMPHGGRLTLETANVSLDAQYCRAHPHARPGEYVMLAVSDTGAGMTADVKAHLFEPFYTTKAHGEGTGLGLAMVYGAVKQNGGSIEVYSEPGHGTTFRIYLPRVDERPEQIREAPRTVLSRGEATVVLVEDEDKVRALATRLLRRQGYRVHAYSNGEEALRAVKEMKEPLHLLITDVVLPGMNGRVLAEQMLALRPDMKVLYTSGYTENVIVQHGVLQKGIEFIAKPYSIESFALRVREVLGQGS